MIKKGDLVKWRWGKTPVPESACGVILKLGKIGETNLDGAWVHWIDLNSKSWTPLEQLVLFSSAF